MSYKEVDECVWKAAKIISKYSILSGDLKLVPIMAPIIKEWLIVDLAINLIGGVTVPLYQSLGPHGIHYILEETDPTSLIGGSADIVKMLKAS